MNDRIDISNELVRFWTPNPTIGFDKDSVFSVTETAMGFSVKAQQGFNSEYVQAIYDISNTVLLRLVRPWLRPDLLFRLSREGITFHRSLVILHDFTRKVRTVG